ncbi:MAG TPA: hypothetical protein DEP35_07285 [Deltaproteobacteria bacterium]|nr:hypothetical protein [Deltaproteobacteria bacterium]
MSSSGQSPYLTRREAAAYLRISTRTLDRLRLPRSRIGAGRVVFLITDLEAYVSSSRAEESLKIRGSDSPFAKLLPRRSMAQVRSRKLHAPNPNWLDDALHVLKKG